MRRFSVVAVLGVLTAIASVGAPSASAATEFGDSCSAKEFVPVSYTLTTLSAPAAALPLTAPVSGVITKVKTQVGIPLPFTFPEQVKLLKPAGGKSYTVTNQIEIHSAS